MAKKIVIDPGHGGSDPGASGNGIVEKDLTLKISKYMKDRFDDLGIESALTRDSDVSLSPNDRPIKVQSLYGSGDDVIVISNHINAGAGKGAEIIYSLRNSDNLASKIANNLILSGQNVRKYYQRRLPSDPSKDYYYILRDTPNNESLIVEYGFLDNKEDSELLKNNYKDLVDAVVSAVASYVGVSYEPKVSENVYVVQKKDTLWGIAKQYNITVDELKKENNLTSNSLTIGQILKIPQKEKVTDNYYIVKKGDTLYGISKKFNISINRLKELNNLKTNLLAIGQNLLVVDNVNPEEYIVEKGDNLYKIAKLYGITTEDLMKYNNLDTALLQVGEKLKIPKESMYKVYEVKKGDNLYKIANMFGTTIEELMNKNNLISDILQIGQKLIVSK